VIAEQPANIRRRIKAAQSKLIDIKEAAARK
jgi:hypothetical protein